MTTDNEELSSTNEVPFTGWAIASISGIVEQGNRIARATDDPAFIPVYVNLFGLHGCQPKAGEKIFVDTLALGGTSYTSADTAYGFMSGTSMAAPMTAALAMLYYNGLPASKDNAALVTAFKDALTPAYKTAILWAAEKGVTRGFSDGTFRDGATCTRGQIVKFLYNTNNLK